MNNKTDEKKQQFEEQEQAEQHPGGLVLEKIRHKKYLHRLTFIQGIVALCICLSASVSTGFAANMSNTNTGPVIAHVLYDSIGIWVSLFCIMTSVIGWGGLYSTRRSTLLSYFTMSILAAVLCLLLIALCLITGISIGSFDEHSKYSVLKARMLLAELTAVLSAIYGILTIISLSFLCYHWNCRCCGNGCCCCDFEDDQDDTSKIIFSPDTHSH